MTKIVYLDSAKANMKTGELNSFQQCHGNILQILIPQSLQ